MKPDSLLAEVPAVREGLLYLQQTDPVFSGKAVAPDHMTYPYMGPGFSTLVWIVLGQQVSTAAARAMWNKVNDRFDDLTPAALHDTSDESLGDLGFSRQKRSYLRGLTTDILQNDLDLETLNRASGEDIRDRLTSLKGFGPWSANMYLIFGLARPDVWAPGDLGIRQGLKNYLNQDERPTKGEARSQGDKFKPYRTAACLYLWAMK